MPAALPIIAGLGLAYSVYAGETQHKAQKKGLRAQQEAEAEAEANAVRQARTAEEEENRARQKSPNLDILLGDQLSKPGPKGIDVDRLLLGRPSLLGV